jgi:hypothetical protein
MTIPWYTILQYCNIAITRADVARRGRWCLSQRSGSASRSRSTSKGRSMQVYTACQELAFVCFRAFSRCASARCLMHVASCSSALHRCCRCHRPPSFLFVSLAAHTRLATDEQRVTVKWFTGTVFVLAFDTALTVADVKAPFGKRQGARPAALQRAPPDLLRTRAGRPPHDGSVRHRAWHLRSPCC